MQAWTRTGQAVGITGRHVNEALQKDSTAGNLLIAGSLIEILADRQQGNTLQAGVEASKDLAVTAECRGAKAAPDC